MDVLQQKVQKAGVEKKLSMPILAPEILSHAISLGLHCSVRPQLSNIMNQIVCSLHLSCATQGNCLV